MQTLKPFAAKVTVENLDRGTAPANAKSTMKVVALGASQAHRLRLWRRVKTLNKRSKH
ncbi:bifunctional PTS system fructose-specific transporter subunit IIA/HPr protein [Actinobacillus equuli]|nr:bifunctional PTS system fructose-specific transporter subunit IIA/HPr protein [Actinobacillus equuli]